jgi:hypothetical protein
VPVPGNKQPLFAPGAEAKFEIARNAPPENK